VEFFIYNSNVIPFPSFPSINSLSCPPSPFFYEGFPCFPTQPPTSSCLPALTFLYMGGGAEGALRQGCPALAESRVSPPIGAQKGHPLLHMQLEPWICPCVLFGWWFSLWEHWVIRIVVFLGLQTPSAPSVLSLTPPICTPFSFQCLVLSICLCICHVLAVPLRRYLYQAPVNLHFLA